MRSPTIKQRRAAINLAENGGNLGKAMLDAGYSPISSKSPQKLTESKGWQELLDEFLPDSLLQQKLNEGLDAGRQISIRGKSAGAGDDDFIEVADYATRHKYLETALKVKGKLIDRVQNEGTLEVIIRRGE